MPREPYDRAMEPSRAQEPSSANPPPLARLLIEVGPLVAFFVANAKFGIFAATGTMMVALVLSLGFSWKLERRLPVMPLVTAVFALVFGSLTLALRDETFFKVKPTIVNLLFATTLFAGLLAGRPLMKVLLGAALQLDEEGWFALTRRWAFFFVFLAAVNEIVWRAFSTDFWVSFKLFGIMPITIAFTMTQVPLIKRHMIEAAPAADVGSVDQTPR